MFRITMEFQKRTEGGPARAAQRDLADILALSGGVPIQVGNDTIGAVGSAGSTLETDDVAVLTGDGQSATTNLLRQVPKLTPPRGHNAISVFALPDRQ